MSFKHEQGICIDDQIQNYHYPRMNTWIIQHMENSKNYCSVIQLRSSLNGTNMDVKHFYPTWKDCCEHLSYCKVLSVVLHQWRLFWWRIGGQWRLHGVLLTKKTMELSQHFFAVKFCHLATKKWLCQSYKGLFWTNPTKSLYFEKQYWKFSYLVNKFQ
jgi:hypothetical protein